MATSLSSRWPGKGYVAEAESTWELVSRVFHDASAVLRKELKALRLKAEKKQSRSGGSCSGMGCACDHTVVWDPRESPDSELVIFGSI